MKRLLQAGAIALVGALCACGTTEQGDPEAMQGGTGEVRLNMGGAGVPSHGTGESMATIVIQNVFDHSKSYLIECREKDHTLEGETFCDELTVLPPGVYEVIVQSHDPNCHAEQDWYKIIVKPNETVEIKINLVCGGANGGLDVIVKETEPPLVTDVDFKFVCHDEVANKFICRHGKDVKAIVTVTDSDTECSKLFENYQWLVNGDADHINPPIIGQHTWEGPEGVCHFAAILDSDSPGPDYDLTLAVSDCHNTTTFTFPIHMIDCGYDDNHDGEPW